MDQSVGPRPVANGYTNARTNKLTLTRTQVKCFNSCQKTCKTHLPFVAFSRAAGAGRARGSPGPSAPGRVSAQPDGEARSGRRSWGRRDAGMDAGWRDGGGARPVALGRGGFTVRGGGRQQPRGECGGARRLVRKPKREDLEPSSLAHPSAKGQGGGARAEERRCGRGAAVRGPAPSAPHFPALWFGGLPGGFSPITHQCHPTASLGAEPQLPSLLPQEVKEPRDEQDKDPAPRIITYLLTN